MLLRRATGAPRPRGFCSAAAPDWAEFRERLRAQAKLLGLGTVRVTAADPSRTLPQFLDWLERGYNGDMEFLARADRLERRRDLNAILPGVRSVVVCTLPYWPGSSGFPEPHLREVPQLERRRQMLLRRTAKRLGSEAVPPDLEESSESRGIMSSYAWGPDYHDLLEQRMGHLASWLQEQYPDQSKVFVDTGALLERDLAARAGIGFVGKNTMLIHPKLGSGFFIGEILSTLPITPDEVPDSMPLSSSDFRKHLEEAQKAALGEPPTAEAAPPAAEKPKRKDGCGTCSRCIDACPTQAFVGPHVLDARRCISYLTIEHKRSIDPALRPLMGSRIYGCDICQLVCPWNSFDWQPSDIPEPIGKPAAITLVVDGARAEDLPGEPAEESAEKPVENPVEDPPLLRAASPLFGRPPAHVSTPELVGLIGSCLDPEAFRERFQGTAVLRIGGLRLLRNVMVALGNTQSSQALEPALKAISMTTATLIQLIAKDSASLRTLAVELENPPAELLDPPRKNRGRPPEVLLRKFRNRVTSDMARLREQIESRTMVIEHADWARDQLLVKLWSTRHETASETSAIAK